MDLFIQNFKLQSNNGWIDLFTAPLITPDRSSYLIKVPKMSDNNKEIFHHMARVSAIVSYWRLLTDSQTIFRFNDFVYSLLILSS